MNHYRFAPSPTGHLHIGGARTALYNFLQAKKESTHFALRIEDTDLERSTQDFCDSILASMQWLGLEHDGEITYQSQRSEIYQKYIQQLLKTGKAYPCFCSPERLEELRNQALQNKQKPKYDNHCRDLVKPDLEQKHCIRFKTENSGQIIFNDLVKGNISTPAEELDDFIIVRSDGSPTYNLVVVIDDALMQISTVIRGDDHINNSPKQIQLYQALDFKIPNFAHIPMILGSDKKRLSKRHGATSVLAYKEEGYLAEALINYLARLGWSHGNEEIFSLKDLIEKFDISAVGKSAAVFNPEKLLWLNAHYIKSIPTAELIKQAISFYAARNINLEDNDFTKQVLDLCKEKAKTLVALVDQTDFFFHQSPQYNPESIQKVINENSKDHLQEFKSKLEQVADFNKENLEFCLKGFIKDAGLKFKEVGQPLRIALTGDLKGPGLYDIAILLGKQRCLERIELLCKTY